MRKFLYIKTDGNDGDYVADLHEIDDIILERLMPVIEAIKDFEPYTVNDGKFDWLHDSNYARGELVREDLGEKSAEELYGHLEAFEEFNGLVPSVDFGCHTIVEIRILDVEKDVKLVG